MLARLLSVTTVSYGLIPLGVLFISWLLQRSFSIRPNTSGDLFTFAAALDLDLILQPSLAARVNPEFAAHYATVFGLAFLFSLAFLIISNETHSILMRKGPKRRFPFFRVSLCWIMSVGVTGFHLYALLGE